MNRWSPLCTGGRIAPGFDSQGETIVTASRYVSSDNRCVAKKTGAAGEAAPSRAAGRLERWLGDIARRLGLEAMSRIK